MTIRPFVAPDDYEAMVALGAVCFPDHKRTVEGMRNGDEQRDAASRFERFVAKAEGKLVGFAEYRGDSWHYHPQKFVLMLMVHPDYRRRGIGGNLFERLKQATAIYDPLAYRTFGNEEHTHTLSFLSKRGFVEELRLSESRLEVATCNLAPFKNAAEMVAAQGIEIKTYVELANYPNRDHILHELVMALFQDVPGPEPFTPVEFEQWKTRLSDPGFLPDAVWVAFDGDKPIGWTELSQSMAGNFLETGLTGVVREYRRRGIASALKYYAVAFARDSGTPYIRTQNIVSNAPMLAINDRMGFQKQPAWINFVLQVKEE